MPALTFSLIAIVALTVIGFILRSVTEPVPGGTADQRQNNEFTTRLSWVCFGLVLLFTGYAVYLTIQTYEPTWFMSATEKAEYKAEQDRLEKEAEDKAQLEEKQTEVRDIIDALIDQGVERTSRKAGTIDFTIDQIEPDDEVDLLDEVKTRMGVTDPAAKYHGYTVEFIESRYEVKDHKVNSHDVFVKITPPAPAPPATQADPIGLIVDMNDNLDLDQSITMLNDALDKVKKIGSTGRPGPRSASTYRRRPIRVGFVPAPSSMTEVPLHNAP